MTCTDYQMVQLISRDRHYLGKVGILAPFRLDLQSTCGIILAHRYQYQLRAPPPCKEVAHPSTSTSSILSYPITFPIPAYLTTFSNGPFRPTTKCTRKPCLRPSTFQKALNSRKIQWRALIIFLTDRYAVRATKAHLRVHVIDVGLAIVNPRDCIVRNISTASLV